MELRLFWDILYRTRRLFLLTFAVILAGGLLLSLVAPTQYLVTSKVYLFKSPTVSAVMGELGLENANVMPSTGLSDSERESYLAMADARPVLDGVIKRLHLTRERKSVQLIQLIPLVRPLMDLLGVHIAPRPLTYEEFTNKSVVHMFFPRPYVTVDLVEDSDLLEYEAWGDSVEQAVAIANASAHAFADRENELRREECVRLQESVDARLPKVRGDYERALADLRDFREKAFSVNMETEAEQFATILYALYAARETNAVDLARRRAEIAAAKTQLDGLPQFRKSSEVIQRNDFAESIKASLRDLSLDLANTRTRFKPDHPAVKDIENKIEEAKKLLKEQAKKVFGSESLNFNPVYQAAEERLLTAYVEEAAYASMDAAYAQVITAREKDIANFAPKQETVALLEARLEAARALYVVFLTLQSQTGGGKDMDFSIVRFVEPAVIPGKLSDHMRPKISLSLAVTVFLAFFLALTAALTAEYLDDAVRSRQDLAACLPPGFTLPVLCLPEAAPDDPRIVQAFRSLRLALARQGRPPALICLTSPAPGQGRARAACGLAASLAALTEDPDAVLVVNADADAPGAFDALFPAPAPDRPGLTDVLAGAADFESAAVGGTVPGTRYLGYGQGAAPAHLLSPADSPAMDAFMRRALSRYRTVILRCPPSGLSCDAALYAATSAWTEQGAALVYIAAWGRASRETARRAAEGLAPASSGPTAFFAALNREPAPVPSPRALLAGLARRFLRRRRPA